VQYGIIALVLVQLGIAAACALLYLRGRNANDMDKRDRETYSARVEVAYGMADSAKKAVETIEVTHYKALAAKYEVACQDIVRLEAQVKSLKESVESLSNKLASRERADRALAAKERRATPDGESALPAESGDPDVDALIRANGYPLSFPGQQQSAPAAPLNTFGRTAKPKGS